MVDISSRGQPPWSLSVTMVLATPEAYHNVKRIIAKVKKAML